MTQHRRDHLFERGVKEDILVKWENNFLNIGSKNLALTHQSAMAIFLSSGSSLLKAKTSREEVKRL